MQLLTEQWLMGLLAVNRILPMGVERRLAQKAYALMATARLVGY